MIFQLFSLQRYLLYAPSYCTIPTVFFLCTTFPQYGHLHVCPFSPRIKSESGDLVLAFEHQNEILQCDHSNESFPAGLSCDAVHYTVQAGSNCWIFG